MSSISHEHYKIQLPLERCRDLLSQFIEHAPTPIAMFDREMRYIMASRRFATDYNLKSQDLIGRSHYEVFPEIPERWKEIHRRCLGGATEQAEEDPFPRADGTLDWVRWEIQPWYDESGAIGGIILFSEVITERKRAEEALQKSEQMLFTVLETAAFAVALTSLPDGVIVYANNSFETLFGFTKQEVTGKTSLELGIYRDPEARARGLAALQQQPSVRNLELGLYTKSGESRICSVNLDVVEIRGHPYLLSTTQDITERKRTEEALADSERRYHEFITGLPVAAYATDVTGRITLYNDAAVVLWGRKPEPGNRWWGGSSKLYTPDGALLSYRQCPMAIAIREHRSVYGFEAVFEQSDGRRVNVVANITPVTDDSGRVVGATNVMLDITERKQAEDALHESDMRFRATFEQAAVGIAHVSPDGRWLRVNKRLCDIVGYSHEELLTKTFQDITHPDDLAADLEFVRQMLAGKIQTYSMEKRYVRKDGSLVWINLTVALVRTLSEEPDYFISAVEDITERKQAEAGRRESEERFRQLTETIREVFWLTDPSQNRILYVSPAYEEIWGRSTESLYTSPNDWAEAIQPEDRSRVLEAIQAKQASGRYNEVYRIVRPDGTHRWIRDRAFPIRDRSGNIYRIAGIAEDITELKQLEAQFFQSQKLEAVGELAGGIAHDFNNNLSAILGFSDLALDHLRPEDPIYRYLTQVKKAGEQSASLTRQLLAFSRKQLLQPKVLDLNVLISELQMMLQRMIGENIELRLLLHPELGHVKADPGQVEQVLMNLVVNARDAMPEGGTLTLQTGNIEYNEAETGARPPMPAGPYIRLTVSDTGCGMDATTQARIFEPFFTTKELGKGTGLGLSTVYGIIKQSGGYIWVASTLGQGTTFTIDLPRVEAPLEATSAIEASMSLRRSVATILLVDDDEMARTVSRETLQARGHTVLEALNGGGAILIAERHQGAIDLLLTDVVMPYMSGPELAQRLMAQRPETKVLYMSGYTDDMLAPHGVLLPGIAFLAKPFTPDGLLRKVQEVLNGAV